MLILLETIVIGHFSQLEEELQPAGVGIFALPNMLVETMILVGMNFLFINKSFNINHMTLKTNKTFHIFPRFEFLI